MEIFGQEWCDSMSQVIDAIEFFNELDILEIRLETLFPLVDRFVISESIKSHTGNPKPLYFEENKYRFKKFWPKIIHQVITDTPENYISLSPDSGKDELHKLAISKVMNDQFWDHNILPYSRDAFEKESLIRAMGFCSPDDIIMFSDADEIPNPDTLANVLENFEKDKIYNFVQDHYWFYLNCLRQNDKWIGNTVLSFDNFLKNSVCGLRKYRHGTMVNNGGWHFSFMGGADKVKQKIESYGEQSINREEYKTKEFIDDCIKNNHDFYRRYVKFSVMPIDCHFPKYLQDNQDKFKEYIKVCE